MFPDNAYRREILNLEVHCDYVSEGCPWQGALKDLDSHVEACEHRRLAQKVSGLEALIQDLNRLHKSMQASVDAMREAVERGIDCLKGTALPVGNPLGGFASIENVHMHSRVAELNCALERFRLSCLDQELRLQLLEQGTYNGQYIWKIDEFERRHREAVKGATISFYSSPFYTGRDGYKMCARVYLNGDGTGKGTHLSLFFVVMKGSFDALLPWPFRQKVTFGLINQMGRGDVTDSFHPDPLSDSFQRPLKEMNVASGCPTFVSRELLWTGGFVKDDCIFLQIKVDTPNSCKKILTEPSPCHHGTKK